MARDSIDSRRKGLFSIYKTCIDGKLAALKSLVQQEIAKTVRRFALKFGVGGQIKHYK